jgi:hypothetical protein
MYVGLPLSLRKVKDPLLGADYVRRRHTPDPSDALKPANNPGGLSAGAHAIATLGNVAAFQPSLYGMQNAKRLPNIFIARRTEAAND